MSDEIGGLRVVEDAFGRPTLKLLHGTYAAVQVAVLRTAFDSDRRSVPTEQLHHHVQALLESFRETGVKVPPGTGKEICRRWRASQWLQRLPTDTGGEVYELTSHALEALELVQSLSKDRPLLSESRLAAIIDAIHRQATDASPDIESKVARLDADISRLTAERDRLLAGEQPDAPTDEAMLEGYVNLMDLISQLPSDFKRVEEGVRDMRQRVLDDFRGDTRAYGQILDEYLARSDGLFATPEGKAFEGALRLLRDDALLAQVKADLDVILDHPFTAVLSTQEIREFRQTVNMVRRGLNDVMGQRSRVTRTLREHIESHDAVKERELSAVLRDLEEELPRWVRSDDDTQPLLGSSLPRGLASALSERPGALLRPGRSPPTRTPRQRTRPSVDTALARRAPQTRRTSAHATLGAPDLDHRRRPADGRRRVRSVPQRSSPPGRSARTDGAPGSRRPPRRSRRPRTGRNHPLR